MAPRFGKRLVFRETLSLGLIILVYDLCFPLAPNRARLASLHGSKHETTCQGLMCALIESSVYCGNKYTRVIAHGAYVCENE